MKHYILWAIMAILCLSAVWSEDLVIVNDTYTLDVGIISDGGWFSVAGINVSIFEPLNRALVVNNQAMTMLSTGQYYYNYVPNTSGVYYYVFDMSNGTDTIFQGAGTFTAVEPQQESDMNGTALILAIAVAMAIFIYIGLHLNKANDVWKAIAMSMIMVLLLLLSKTAIDVNNVCELSNGSLTCVAGPMTAGNMFYQLMLWSTIAYFTYLIVTLMIMAIDYLKRAVSR